MKLLNILIVVATILILSCSKNDFYNKSEKSDMVMITASFVDNNTKTTLDGLTPKWAEGDKIMITNGSNESRTITLSNSGTPSETLGVITDDDTKFNFLIPGSWSKLYAVYPASCAISVSSDKVNFTIPPVQDGSFASANICIAKKINSTTLQFKNATVVLNVAPKSSGAISNDCMIFDASSSPIVGDFTASFDSEGNISKVSSKSDGTTYSILKGHIHNQDASYYAIAPISISFSKKLTLKVRKSNTLVYATKEYSRSSSLVINKIYNFRPSFSESSYIGHPFSVSQNKTVSFSSGNLFYTTNDGLFHFESNQYDFRHHPEAIDIHGIGYTAIVDGKCLETTPSNTVGSFKWTSNVTTSITKDNSYSGSRFFATDNISVGQYNDWRSLTYDEINYLLFTRSVNGKVNTEGYSYQRTSLVLPDGITLFGMLLQPNDCSETLSTSTSWETWLYLESQGFVFLPASGSRVYNASESKVGVSSQGSNGFYWSSTIYTSSMSVNNPFCFNYGSTLINLNKKPHYYGCHVRLVR